MPVACPVCRARVGRLSFAAHAASASCTAAARLGSPDPKRPRLRGPGQAPSDPAAGLLPLADCPVCRAEREAQTGGPKERREEERQQLPNRATHVLSLEPVARKLFPLIESLGDLRSALLASRQLRHALAPERRLKSLQLDVARPAEAVRPKLDDVLHRFRLLRSLTLQGGLDLVSLAKLLPHMRLKRLTVATAGPQMGLSDVVGSPFAGLKSLSVGLPRAHMGELCRLLPASLHCLRLHCSPLQPGLGEGWVQGCAEALIAAVERLPSLHYLSLGSLSLGAKCGVGARPFHKYMPSSGLLLLENFLRVDPSESASLGFQASQMVRLSVARPPADLGALVGLERLSLSLSTGTAPSEALSELASMPGLRSLGLVLRGCCHEPPGDWLDGWRLLEGLPLARLDLLLVQGRRPLRLRRLHLPKSLRRLSVLFAQQSDGQEVEALPQLPDAVLHRLSVLRLDRRLLPILQKRVPSSVVRMGWSWWEGGEAREHWAHAPDIASALHNALM